MNKPNNYDTTSAGGFTPPALGGHKCIIKEVKESQSRGGLPMVVMFFDFDDSDVQPGYFTEQFRDDIRPDKKWPYAGTMYIVTEDHDGNCTRSFKQFTTAFEKSNNTEIKWGSTFVHQFKNRVIGVVFGEVENEYNGRITMRHQPRWVCDIDKADGAEIPKAKMLNGTEIDRRAAAVSSNDFVNVPEGVDEELPFA